MIIKNLATQAELTLSHDLQWADEHTWSKVAATSAFSLTGALLIETSVKLAGRPITLKPPSQDMAWHPRSTVDLLRTWSDLPGQQFLLTLDDGRSFTVVFRHADAPVIEAEPIKGFPTYEPDDDWLMTLKMMEV